MERSISYSRLITSKADLGNTRIQEVHMPGELEKGEVLLAVEAFALTTNNITYAAFGDAMRYWDFFPTGESEWGAMPVWGFAKVAASTVPEIEVGERFYGYLPMADFLRVTPGRLTETGFYVEDLHRQGLPSPYNQYTRCSTDPAYVPELADFQMLLRPLFFTSYMLADFLEDNGFFGAKQIITSSASSKTAYGMAFCLREMDSRPALVGLTSARHVKFVSELGLYDSVLSYDEVGSVAADVPSLYVDFSGADAGRSAIHQHLGEHLTYDCYAGSTMSTDYLHADGRYSPAPMPFFAPIQIKKRNQDWGRSVLAQRFGDVQRKFLTAVADPSRSWMNIEKGQGYADAARVVTELCKSGGLPQQGHIIRLGGH